jgi:hypothetical protein
MLDILQLWRSEHGGWDNDLKQVTLGCSLRQEDDLGLE